MLQLIERREGVRWIPRPPLPPRRVARPLLVALGLLVLTVAGMLGGLRLAGSTTHRTELGTVSFSVSPSIHGRVDAFVPIANWGARGHAFQAPLTVHVEPRAVNRRAVLGAAAGNGTVLAQSERDARHAARASLLRAYRWAIGGALALGLLLGAALIRRPGVRRGQLIVITVTPPLCAILIGGAVLLRVQSTFDPNSFDHPHFYARGAELEQLLKVADNAQREGAGYTSQVQRALGGFAAFVAAGGRFSRGLPPTHRPCSPRTCTTTCWRSTPCGASSAPSRSSSRATSARPAAPTRQGCWCRNSRTWGGRSWRPPATTTHRF